MMDWQNIPEPAVREILRQGETYLDGTLKTGIGADQRATTLMGIYGAIGVALLVVAATLETRPQPDLSLIGAIVVTAFLVLLAGVICGLAGRPIDFYVGGYEPEKIVRSSTDELWLLRFVCEDLQRRIDINRRTLEKSAALISKSFLVAGAAIVVGIVVFVCLRVMTLS
jgi:hypothetical protein